MTIARHLRVHGRVQGVWYRGWTVETARSLGLSGWVRNRLDGTVEAFVQGDDVEVERFIDLAHGGSPGARVTEVKVTPQEPDATCREFRQAPTT